MWNSNGKFLDKSIKFCRLRMSGIEMLHNCSSFWRIVSCEFIFTNKCDWVIIRKNLSNLSRIFRMKCTRRMIQKTKHVYKSFFQSIEKWTSTAPSLHFNPNIRINCIHTIRIWGRNFPAQISFACIELQSPCNIYSTIWICFLFLVSRMSSENGQRSNQICKYMFIECEPELIQEQEEKQQRPPRITVQQ